MYVIVFFSKAFNEVSMANTATGVEASAIQVLKRAVELDTSRRFDEAVVCYQEGLQLLIQVLKGNCIHVFQGKFLKSFMYNKI